MQTLISTRRKLIDLKPAVFESLSLEAQRQGVSLKRLIESLLESACPRLSAGAESGISRLIGSALPKDTEISSIKDERLNYLLSK